METEVEIVDVETDDEFNVSAWKAHVIEKIKRDAIVKEM